MLSKLKFCISRCLFDILHDYPTGITNYNVQNKNQVLSLSEPCSFIKMVPSEPIVSHSNPRSHSLFFTSTILAIILVQASSSLNYTTEVTFCVILISFSLCHFNFVLSVPRLILNISIKSPISFKTVDGSHWI